MRWLACWTSIVESVNSAIKRARHLQRRPSAASREPPSAAGSPAEGAIVAKFARAWESADLNALVAPSDGRRLHVDAADALRIRGPGRHGPFLRQPVRRGSAVRPGAGASQPPAGVRRLPAQPVRHQSRHRPRQPQGAGQHDPPVHPSGSAALRRWPGVSAALSLRRPVRRMPGHAARLARSAQFNLSLSLVPLRCFPCSAAVLRRPAQSSCGQGPPQCPEAGADPDDLAFMPTVTC
jgi:hypothetical protein